MTMFQILTQKGWLDIMHSTMRQSKDFSPLVAIYFISYHVFVTLVILKYKCQL
jgi:sodium leak channel non-selective protein